MVLLCSLTIREKSDYSSRQSSLEECSGAGIVFLQDGVVSDLIANDSEDPRTAIGYHDKTLVILVADGRQSNWSAGLNYTEMGYIMKAMGCTWAANLDGGKSSELVVWNLESGKYKVHNRICSDNHSERNIAESWMIFTDTTTN